MDVNNVGKGEKLSPTAFIKEYLIMKLETHIFDDKKRRSKFLLAFEDIKYH